jgi:hypothetical protein
MNYFIKYVGDILAASALFNIIFLDTKPLIQAVNSII